MTVQTPAAGETTAYAAYEEHGSGWVTFAGIMLMIVGTMNVISGIAAIDNANFYVGNAQFFFSDLNTWGWIVLIIGAAQLLSALGIWARNQFARWLGVLFASLNAIAQLLFLPAQPLFSLALFTIDILVIYGLIAYGRHEPAV
ncbi:MAG TPA: hypothetical protein VF752_01530 [Thermoleophilaceae bacterium]